MNVAELGLGLNIIGTLLLFFFGFPQPDFEESVGFSVEDNTPVGNGLTAKQYAEKIKHKKKIYKIMSYLALSLILFGFVVQFMGN
jgi:hypothetical protein